MNADLGQSAQGYTQNAQKRHIYQPVIVEVQHYIVTTGEKILMSIHCADEDPLYVAKMSCNQLLLIN